uniref:Protein kinase domain-containing protein n=1 Tax=Eutreptiella gymnastica TaxID=73025 RepID=A0A7S4D2P5_9EUGL
MPIERLEFEEGGQYEGETQDGIPHGKGRFTWPEGDSYYGDWVKNTQQGYGIMTWANGDVYEGEFENDLQQGQGKMTYHDGKIWEGGWKEDEMCGKGKLTYPDGRVYEGEMLRNKRHGRGKETLTSGDFYEGDWEKGRKHGKGFFQWANGDSYDGDYVNGEKLGEGIFKWANGDTYEGEVKGGKKHGKGIHRLVNGDYYVGEWQDGEQVGQVKRYQGTTEYQKIISDEEINQGNISSSQFLSADDDLTSDDLEGWKRGNIIGKGAFGHVYLGLLKNGKFMAVKTMEFGESSSNEDLEQTKSELNIMKKVCHKNVVRYLGSHLDEGTKVLNIFVEYMPQGSIATVAKKFNPLPTNTIRAYTTQILEGLQYLHTQGIVHRDIKGDNILMDNNGVAKLADLGCSKKLDDICSRTHGCNTMVGTPYWMAPEVISTQEGYGTAADIWSVGCTIVEMLTSKPPWPEFHSMWAAIYHIANSDGPPDGIPKDLEPDLQDLLDKCFERNPKKRATAAELLKHPFLQGPEN